MKDDQKNFLLFALLAGALLFGWPIIANWMFPSQNPAPTRIVDGKSTPVANPKADPAADSPKAIRDRALVLRETAGQRVAIDTPSLKGSINLKGARIDDLVLVKYPETIAKGSEPIRLLSPGGTADAYFAGFGWRDDGLKPPSADTVWQASGTVLSPGKPITLSTANGQGQIFRIELTIDDKYMFTVKQTVANTGTGVVPVAPYGLVYRNGMFKEPDSWTVHVGPMSVHNGGANYGVNFKDLDGEKAVDFTSNASWLGFTDKYWLTALIPDQTATVAGKFRGAPNSAYQADYAQNPQLLQPGKQISQTSRFFAGAKETALLDTYEGQGVTHFGRAIDWGWFEILEKPIFYYVDMLYRLIGNFGVAIILLTVTIRALIFPIANKQFQSMANMRAIQPKMKALQERHKDDKQRQQQEIMKLYKEEKVNPLAGCLPILLQIPIMYSLYKVLLLTIEMRHKPFTLWIHDLSAPDPATILDFFGYAPWAGMLPHFLAIGVVPVLLGVSMYYQIKLNPAPMDDMQKQIFAIMPWMLMFVMAPFAVGLQLYWITSNCITIAQQRWLYSRHPALKEPLPKKDAAAK